VLEALACGLPVITTGVSVLPELIGAGGGQLLTEAGAVELSEAVRGILSDTDRYNLMTKRAFETAQQYSLECWRDTVGQHLRSAWSGSAVNEVKSLRADG
jgi:glycosyltransferase involved in cell wall biosynthesis